MKTLLFKPFEKYPESKLLLVGMVLLCVGTLLAFLLNTRFDGALDIHYGMEVDMKTAVIDQGISLISMVFFLFVAGLIVNSKTRLIDVFSTMLIARIPLYVASLLNLGGFAGNAGLEVQRSMMKSEATISSQAIVVLVISLVIIIPMVVWSVALMWNGYKVAANAKGAKAILLFIGAVLLAEIASKTALYFLK